MSTARTTARRFAPVLLVAAAFATETSAVSAQAKLNQYGYPEKHTPKPTTAAITQQDLMTRLYIFADDSMQGRQIGRVGNEKGTAYIARELKRLGIEPGGDNGTYFQALPGYNISAVSRASLTVDGRSVAWNADFVTTPLPQTPAAGEKIGIGSRTLSGVEVIYGGTLGDSVNTITAEQANGKIVVVRQAAGQAGGRAGGGRAGGGGNAMAKFSGAAAIATINLDGMTPAQLRAISAPPQAAGPGRGGAPAAGAAQPPLQIRLSSNGAAALFGGRDVTALSAGAMGGKVNATFDYTSTPKPEYARNVVGIVRGSDPALRGQFVAIGAHNDHVGFGTKVDHDSAFAARHARMKLQIVGDTIKALTAEQLASININVDSLRKVRPVRWDSINNGADDDGSGSMAVLEIAEAIQRASVKPKRSIIFVWHTGEEAGLLGSRYFADNPTVPRDSIVAQINIDMIGRGRAEDLPNGGPDYLGVVGAYRLSTELGEMVTNVNKRQPAPLRLDAQYDGDVTKTLGASYNNIYGRSDHANYARYNIPIAFFFTGLHGDYHQTTDEPQYIDYPHYTKITNYIKDVILEVGNAPKRPNVDKKPVS